MKKFWKLFRLFDFVWSISFGALRSKFPFSSEDVEKNRIVQAQAQIALYEVLTILKRKKSACTFPLRNLNLEYINRWFSGGIHIVDDIVVGGLRI